MKFKVCPICGDHLDHGEVCQCKKEGAPAGTGTPSNVGKCESSTTSLSNPYWDVNNLLRLKTLLDDTGTMSKDVALIVREKFPKFTRQLLSMSSNYGEYGVIIHPDGLRVICEAYGIALNPAPDIPITVDEPAPKKSENRKLGRKVTFRVTNGDFEIIQKRVQDEGYDSVQAWLYAIITELLGNQNEEDCEENPNE